MEQTWFKPWTGLLCFFLDKVLDSHVLLSSAEYKWLLANHNSNWTNAAQDNP